MTSSRPERTLREAARRVRRTRQANAWISLFLSTLLLVMVQVLASRHFLRLDVSRDRLFSLSPETRAFLRDIQDPVEAAVFLRRDHPHAEFLDPLLRELHAACPLLRITWIDPEREPGLADAWAARFEVTESGTLAFATGARIRQLNIQAFFDDEADIPAPDNETRHRGFRAEESIASTLFAMLQEKPPVVYFLTGHGERELDSFDPRRGYSRLARRLRLEALDVRPLRWGDTPRVPADADAVVIAGPRYPIPQPAVDRLGEYLESGGRLLVAADETRTGLEVLLESWSIRLGKERVFDPERTISGHELLVMEYATHPVTDRLRDSTTVFYRARPAEPIGSGITPTDRADQPYAVALAWTSPASWARPDQVDPSARPDPERDRRGPIVLASAAERGAIPGLGVRIAPSRLVVFGDAQFVANGAQSGAGLDFFMDALRWILEKDLGQPAPARPLREARWMLTRRERRMLFFVAVLGWPAAAVLAGGLVAWRRRA